MKIKSLVLPVIVLISIVGFLSTPVLAIDVSSFDQVPQVYVALTTAMWIVIIMVAMLGAVLIAFPEARMFIGGLVSGLKRR